MNNHKNQPVTMENQPGTMKNQPGTMNNHKNRPGTMKNQPGTINNHNNRPKTIKKRPGTNMKLLKTMKTHLGEGISKNITNTHFIIIHISS